MELTSTKVIAALGVMNVALLGLGFTQWAGNWVDLRAAVLKAPTPMSLPNTFTYQGKLTKPDGTALPDGLDYYMEFVLFDTKDPGMSTELCHWAVQNISVKQGNFRAVIGSVDTVSDGTCKGALAISNIFAQYPEVFLEVRVRKGSVGTTLETLTPRVSIGSTPRAQHAAIAEVAKTALDGVPVGAITPFFGNENQVPVGWLVANGQPISKVLNPEYSSLVAHLTALGAPYATGDSDTARRPDLRGVFLRGMDLDAGMNPEAVVPERVGATQSDAFRKHNHHEANGAGVDGSLTGTGTGSGSCKGSASGSGSTTTDGAHQHCSIYHGGAGNSFGAGWDTGGVNLCITGGGHGHTVSVSTAWDWGQCSVSASVATTADIFAAGGSETRPKNVSVLYLIKY